MTFFIMPMGQPYETPPLPAPDPHTVGLLLLTGRQLTHPYQEDPAGAAGESPPAANPPAADDPP